MPVKSTTRPIGITALSMLFSFGATAGFVSFISLLFPGSFLEPLWKINPRAREGFTGIGGWSVVLMFAVCAACTLTAVGGNIDRLIFGGFDKDNIVQRGSFFINQFSTIRRKGETKNHFVRRIENYLRLNFIN